MPDYKDLDAKLVKISKRTIEMCSAAGSGHPSTGLSLAHLTVALMYRAMRYDPQNPWNATSDRLVLSEGHAVPIIYAAYCELGGIAGTKQSPQKLSFDDTLTLRESDSVLDGHPNPPQGFPFFDAATGSLGQGASVAAGLAAAARLDGLDKQIYCVIGDGEAREGQIWEAVDFIADHKLTAVKLIFNANGQGQSDYVSPQQSAESLRAKLQAFNFEVKVVDGHNWDDIFTALASKATDKPIAIVAKTVKGWGSNELSSKNYHGKILSDNQVEQAMADFDVIAAKLGVDENAKVDALKITIPQDAKSPTSGNISAGSFADALKAAGFEKQLQDKKLATRTAYGVALEAIGADERIVALDGDVQGSTFANMFANKYSNRYFEGKIAEQNMISAAVGLAASGKIPFVSSFAKFLVRGYDQIEMAVIGNSNVKLCGSHSGVSLAADGPSQMGLPDLAFIRSFAHSNNIAGDPAIRMFCPSDAVSAFKLTEQMANTSGLCYMRTQRPNVDFLYDLDEEFPFGGHKRLASGKDMLIVASGYMVHIAMEALAILKAAGVNASLVDVYSIPLKTEGVLEIAKQCQGKMLVVEDNYVGGFGDELACAVAEGNANITCKRLYVTTVPKSAKTPDDILKQVNLTADDLANAAQNFAI